MRIFLTGASGFIGTQTAAALSRHHEVLCLSRRPQAPWPHGRVIAGDLGRPEDWRRKILDFAPEALIHLAWEGIPDFSFNNCLRNMGHSVALIRLLGEMGCSKILAAGSCWEYGGRQGACPESAVSEPQSNFVWAKEAVRRYLQMSEKVLGLNWIWFRIFFAYGPGQRSGSLVPTLFDADPALPSPLKNPDEARDFVYVADVAEAFRLAVEKTVPSGIYNLGSGQATKVADIQRMISRLPDRGRGHDASARRGRGEKKPPAALRPRAFWADTRKTRETLGWFAKTSLPAGLRLYSHSLGTAAP